MAMSLWTCPCLPFASSEGSWLGEPPHSRESERAPLPTALVTEGQSRPSPALSSCRWEGLAKAIRQQSQSPAVISGP